LNAVGILVTGVRVGVVDFGGGQFAIYAEGTASLVGIGSFVTLSAPVVVRVNKTNRAVNASIPITGGPNIPVVFTSPAFVEKFSVGTSLNRAVIDFGHVVTLTGAIGFTVAPSGRIDVDIPVADVGISIPFDGQLTSAFGLTSA